MEFLRKLILQTKVHLQGLTVSQRLAIGSCVILIAVALFALVKWAAVPAMSTLLDQPTTAEEMSRIQQYLDTTGVKYQVVANVIQVPTEMRSRILAQLTQQQLLPSDISIGFAKLVGEASNPWLSQQEQDRRWNLARSNELARVLREFNGVRDARVFIESTTRRQIGQPNVQPTASVYLKLSDGASLNEEMVRAIAGFVSSAVSNLSIHNVTVADATTGRARSVPRTDDGLVSSEFEYRQKQEEYFAKKVQDLLAAIPVLVKVHCELDSEARQETKMVFGKPALSEERTESETETSSPVTGEPGVVPNTNVSVTGAAPVTNHEKSTSETRYKSETDKTVTETSKPRYTIKSIAASVNIPKSYLVGVFKLAKEPTDQELDTMSTGLRDKIRKQVMTVLDIPAGQEDRVSVDWFPDTGAIALAQLTDGGAGENVAGMVYRYWDKAGMGVLAVLGLVMMLMMVRKVGEGPVLPGEEAPVAMRKRGLPIAEVEEEVPVSEARETEPLLVGKEVDEETLRSQQIIQQVSELIKADPASSASILQRWIDEANA